MSWFIALKAFGDYSSQFVSYTEPSPLIWIHEMPVKASRMPQEASKSSNVTLGLQLALNAGYDLNQWSCLYELGKRESGWDNLIWNRGGSGAFGIAQSLPATKYDPSGKSIITDPAVQINWMIDYVNNRYGGACQANQFQLKSGWY